MKQNVIYIFVRSVLLPALYIFIFLMSGLLLNHLLLLLSISFKSTSSFFKVAWPGSLFLQKIHCGSELEKVILEYTLSKVIFVVISCDVN